jgi:hypothetical protein
MNQKVKQTYLCKFALFAGLCIHSDTILLLELQQLVTLVDKHLLSFFESARHKKSFNMLKGVQ